MNSTPEVMFARPTTSGWGKSTETLKTLVPPEVKEDFQRHMRSMGFQSDGDALRELILLVTYGHDWLRSLHQTRVDLLARNMAEIVPEKPSQGVGA